MAVLALKLEWKEEYSVGVVEIDNQHKLLFATEEDYFKESNFEGAEEHIKEHQKYIDCFKSHDLI